MYRSTGCCLDTGMAETKLLQIPWDNIKDKEEIESLILEHKI